MSSTTETRASVTVSDLARDSGVSASAVRFYEDSGLITAERTPGNQRRFTPGDACRIKVIRVAQRVGLSVHDIKTLLELLPETGEPTTEQWSALQKALVQETNRRVRELNLVLADLSSDTKLCALAPLT